MSAPGQTAGLSVFTDPLIGEMEVSRTAVSISYLIGTLVGAAALPFVGRALDRWGVRAATALIGVAAYARYYGTTHIGAIRGVATAVSLASTAVGPLPLSVGHDVAGGYHLPVLVLATLPAAVAALSLFARAPHHPSRR